MKRIEQRQILRMLATGHTYEHIAKTLGITKAALYNHAKRIRQKGIEPSDVNAVRQYLLPGCKPLPVDKLQEVSVPEKHMKLLRLVDQGEHIETIRVIMGMGLQSARNMACEAFHMVGIFRLRKPERVWRAQLRGYLESLPPKQVSMDDPAFN